MTAVYVQNISPHKTLRNMTLEDQGEKDQDRPFRQKGYIYGVQ
jgi:hypothetical protein